MNLTGPKQLQRGSRTGTEAVVVAHRGASGRAPENTGDSFRLAALLEADAVETDIRRARDGSLVLIHDASLDRTTDGMGLVADHDLAALRRLEAGSWFGPGFQGQRILSVDEGLALFRDLGLGAVIEIKEPETSPDVARAVRSHRMVPKCHIVSFLPSAIAAVREAEPQLTGTLILDPRSDIFRERVPVQPILAALESCGAVGVALYYSVASPELVGALRERSVAVSLLLLNRVEDIRGGLELGPEAILTDFPDRVLWATGAARGGADSGGGPPRRPPSGRGKVEPI